MWPIDKAEARESKESVVLKGHLETFIVDHGPSAIAAVLVLGSVRVLEFHNLLGGLARGRHEAQRRLIVLVVGLLVAARGAPRLHRAQSEFPFTHKLVTEAMHREIRLHPLEDAEP